METKFGDIYHLIKVILIRLGTTEETSSSTGSRINHSEWLTFSRLEGPRAFVFAFIPYLVTSENYKAYKLDEGNKCEGEVAVEQRKTASKGGVAHKIKISSEMTSSVKRKIYFALSKWKRRELVEFICRIHVINKNNYES